MAVPDTLRRNAANARSVLDAAIVNNSGAFMGFYRLAMVDGGADGASPLSAADRDDIVAYINSVFTSNFSSGNVAYGGMITIPLPDIATTSTAPASTVITGLSTVGSPTGGTVSYNNATPSATFTHTATNCSNASFTYHGTGIFSAATSNRTVTVPVTAPAAPTVSGGPFTIAYSTGATAIPIVVGGSATSLVVGALSGSAGTLNATGTSLTYTASSTTYAASQTFTLQAVGPCASSAVIMVTLNVMTPPAPVITSSNMASGTGGQAFSFNVTASNAPTSFAASGLPAGLSINTANGAITGTPTVSGMFTAMVTATGPGGTSAAQALNINIGLVTPAITSSLSVAATSGSPFTYTITASNLPASFNASGLPSGLSVDMVTGVISGTPVVAMGGAVAVMLSATNGAGTGNATLMINISLSAPTITSANTASGTVGTPFTFNLTGTDFPTSFAASPLPAGLSLNAMTGVISGTPTTPGSTMVTVSGTNGAGTGPTQTLTITITLLPPSVTSGASVNVVITNPVSYQITASNSPTSYGATGLPAGVTVNTMTGLISGTPTAVGTYNVTVSATNAAGTGTKAVTITVSNFSPPTMNGATINVPFGGTGTVDFFLLSGGSNVTSYAITTPALRGSIAVNGTVATYTPQAGFFGMDSFAVTATGPGGNSPPATINVIVGTPGAPTVAARSVSVPYNTSAVINLASSITGVATTVAISAQPANGTVSISGLTVTYKPNTDFFGADSFAYTATGPGGTSMPATVSITIATQAPSANAVRFMVPLNTATTMDLKPFVTGSAISGIRVMSDPKFGKASVNGTKVVYTPNSDYFGDDTFTYVAFGNAGTSAAATVTVTIVGRPAANKNANVAGLATAQMASSQRAAQAQIGNVQSRLETLRRSNEVEDLSAAREPRAPTTVATSLTEGVTDAAKDAKMRAVAARGSTTPTETATSPSPVAAAAAGLITSRQVSIGNVAQLATSGEVNRAPDSRVGATNYWVGGSAQFGVREAKGDFSGSEFTTSGITFGVDRRFRDDLALGLGFGFSRDNTRIGNDGSTSKAKSASLSLYGSYQPSRRTFVDGLVGFGRLNFDSRRVVSTTGDFASADRDGRQVYASLASGYEKRDNGVLWSPYGRLDYVNNRLDAVNETGVGINALNFGSQSQPSLQGTVGVRAESIHRTDFGAAAPRARLEFRHEFQGGRDASVSYADLTSTRYALVSTTVLRNAIVASVGADLQFRRGLMVGIDYQVTHAFNRDSSQGLRLTVTQPLDGKGNPLLFGAMPLTFSKPQDIQVDAGYMFDDNVTRAKAGPNKLSDRVYSVNAGKGFNFTFEDRENIRAVVNATLGAEKFDRWSGLDRAIAGLEADVKYKTSPEFDAYTFGATLQLAGDQYHSVLRRGYRATATLSARQQVTDRIGLFAALSHTQRWAKSAVWDNRFSAIRLNADYAWNNNDTLYLTQEFRKGHSVSTGSGSLEDLAAAQVFVDDDAFPGRDFNSYRFKGNTWISTIGYNMGFGPRHALDLSWRRAQSTPDIRPSYATTPKSYIADQYSIIYLIRF